MSTNVHFGNSRHSICIMEDTIILARTGRRDMGLGWGVILCCCAVAAVLLVKCAMLACCAPWLYGITIIG